MSRVREAALASKESPGKVPLDIAKEEKNHVGESQALLLLEDKEQKYESAAGKAAEGSVWD